MGWYDDPKNSVGALCARLSGDAAAVQGVSTALHPLALLQITLYLLYN